ncbi:MAG TPA: serine/threonine protein kinase [Cyanobacteria bacterium UBA11369]|nr:serine/threonine protein kinase [Cyanobacteria bacterium UBA11371]HBE31817.1 serine/threonine protein kinase [Cyanobacteria bacterium UBA11368]HBE53444.1 serine/threonine protein kinase [Cyanobacteria bacterium UBA11369]
MTTITIPGYRVNEQIYNGNRTQVWLGVKELDNQPVAIKLLQSEYPTFTELVQFRNQYTIAKNLDLPGIVKHLSLENYRNGLALIMEDYGGISLANYLTAAGLEKTGKITDNLADFFDIALQIVTTLEGLYRCRIIHKDIKPQNILINPQTKQVKLIDFSIASLLPRETQEIQNPNQLEGTLAYISPEQTGRMNRGIDYRTDFYSLGVTFYELLTGQLPFQSTDPMELVHSHIARKAIPPIAVNPAIPQILNDIVMKLMAKTAEDRYQTAFGIKYDLEKCWEQYAASGTIAPFELGRRDISERFVIPEKLYGRETEVETLLTAFERISAGNSEIMLVAGFSGIGKTAVVNEVHKPIVRQRGYFIKGKFDQFKRNIPFSAWVQALQNLMRQLLTETAAVVQEWKAKILAALGENGQVIIDVIPELELLIGKQPPAPELEGSAAQNRFNLLFQKFIRLFATQEHPLVIFLDDLQWADSASLKLMQLLLSDGDTRCLLLIGAYRDNEVSPAHPLMLTLDEIQKTEATVNQITLAPLDKPSLNCLIADTLSCPPERAISLTELVLAKTKGNPFFTNQFLKALYEDGLISFDFSCNYWQCDIAQVKAISVSDDVVEFMATQLQKLPENTQAVLKLAACIGNTFDLATLAIVHEKSQAETAADLWKALQEGLVIPISEVYKFFQDESSVKGQENVELTVPYKFLHDRVQQAAYFLIPEDQKQSTHLKIGRLLLTNTPETEREDKIFDIVNQLNIAVDLIDSQTEKNELVQLNLVAGRKAKASTAYAAAIGYLSVGMKLLTADSWQTNYDQTLALYELAAESAYLGGNFEQMEAWSALVLNSAKTLLDQVKVYEVKIQAYMAQTRGLDAVKTGLQVLKLLGINFPENPQPSDIQQAMVETRANLGSRQIEDLINLPPMTDPEKLAAMQILSSLSSATYISAPQMYPLTVCQRVNLSLQYGNAAWSAFAYATYGLIMCGVVGDIEFGYQFGRLALTVASQFNVKEIKPKTFFIFGGMVAHWKEPVRKTLKPLLESYQIGLETGDLEYAAYSACYACHHLYFAGAELTELEEEMASYSHALKQLKQIASFNYNEIFRQAVLNLLGESENRCLLVGEAYDEEELLSQHLEGNDRNGLHYLYLNKLILCYLFGELPQAVQNAAKAEEYIDSAIALLCVPLFHFYDSLVQLAILTDPSTSDRERILEKVTQNQQKIKTWAERAPMNHLHKFYLVEAERHRVLGENVQAMDDYDLAIKAAKENEYVNEEALANELAAKFYLAWGKETIAQTYMLAAYYAYSRWGAKAKIADLEKCYPQLLAPIFNRNIASQIGDTIIQSTHEIATSQVTNTTGTSISSALDLTTVIEASQIISGEINLDKLISTLMQVVIENAGATGGALILERSGELFITAQSVGNECHLQSISVDNSQEIPGSIVNYVWRTAETIAINDAIESANWAADPYIIQHHPKSVLCLPIQHQGMSLGILYLENNLTEAAFTSDRLKLLKLLSSQAAISIQNASLYQTLEDKVQERTAQLAEANHQLALANQEITTLNYRLKEENIRLSAELDVARQLQQMVLPKPSEFEGIKDLEIAGFMEPADEVGGDYYDVLSQNGKVTLTIGDVTGHGLESGVLMIMAQTAVRTLQESNETDPVKFMDVLNRTLYGNLQRMNSLKNMTLALLEYQDGILNLSGQHEEIIVVRTDGNVERIDTVSLGFPIGLEAEIADFVAQTQVLLNPGDVVVLYTDGITEAEDINRRLYGLDRLCEVVRKNRHLVAEEIRQVVIEDVRQHIGEQKVFDDITLLVLKQK